jgi:hypothetical protein
MILRHQVRNPCVRTLVHKLDADQSAKPQLALFHIIDIVLTAGVLAGGTNGINAISELLGTYTSVSRKRALERT